jgi:hypothetical protein
MRHDLLIYNMLTCILHKAFVVEMLEMNWWKASASIQTGGNPTYMFAMVHYFLRKMLVAHGRCNVQNKEELSGAVHAYLLTSTHQFAHETVSFFVSSLAYTSTEVTASFPHSTGLQPRTWSFAFSCQCLLHKTVHTPDFLSDPRLYTGKWNRWLVGCLVS